ncbi:LysR family transcriptional regulator [Rhodobacterales bacterium HKCCE2091]|nr:LysR family transcriptional regulator [Rhodobacterales bacterium HKCCE2091]
MRHLKIYRAIRAIHRSGSIRKAAADLALSPSALNRAVQGFEAELGGPVFERLPAGVRLSRLGELLMPLIDAHLSQVDEFRVLVTEMQDGAIGELRLSLASDLPAGRCQAALAEFRARHPRVEVTAITSDTAGPLLSRQVDLAILSHPETDDRVEVAVSRRSPLVARVAGRAGPVPDAARLTDFIGRPWLAPPPGTGTRIALAHLSRRLRLDAQRVTSVPGLWPVLTPGPEGDVQFLPAHGLPDPSADRAATHVPVIGGEVQLAALVRAGEPLAIAPRRYLALLERYWD